MLTSVLVGDVITLVFTALLESQGWDLETVVGMSHRQRSQSGSVLCHASVEAEQDGGRGQDGGYNAGGQLGALGAGHCQ